MEELRQGLPHLIGQANARANLRRLSVETPACVTWYTSSMLDAVAPILWEQRICQFQS